MQQRHPPPNTRARPRSRLASAAGGLIGSSGSAGIHGGTASSSGTVGRLAAQPRLPPRSTKLSEKLVLLPETSQVEEDGDVDEEEEEEEYDDEAVDEELVARLAKDKGWDPERIRQQLVTQKKLGGDFGVDNDIAPLLAEEELLRRRKVAPERAKSYAERLPKARRAEKLARVTAYCTAQAYKMSSLASFVKEQHGGRTKLYDDCLYTAYHLPLLPGNDGYRLRSSPMVKKPGGKSLLDEEIERNELRDYHDEFNMEAEEHSVGGRRMHHMEDGLHQHEQETPDSIDRMIHNANHENHRMDEGTETLERPSSAPGSTSHEHLPPSDIQDRQTETRTTSTPSMSAAAARLAYDVAEMFVFSYGVVVFWNLTENQEKDILADLAFATSSLTGSPIPLATMPLQEEDFETEEFHFEYSTEISRPRVYNDMITLRNGDHMIKLAISHGIAQSTKLCFFEEVMARQMAEAKDVPRRLAVTGKLGLKREEVFRILGRLFKSRVEVNLSSNMLDVPNFFWESEPTLYPLYIAVREYLEIKPRIQVLNERCRVFLDLAEILSDSIADTRTSRMPSPSPFSGYPIPYTKKKLTYSDQTWIIIVLIVISILVTTSEVFLRFGMISSSSSSAATVFARALGLGSGSGSSTGAGAGVCNCPAIPESMNSTGLEVNY